MAEHGKSVPVVADGAGQVADAKTIGTAIDDRDCPARRRDRRLYRPGWCARPAKVPTSNGASSRGEPARPRRLRRYAAPDGRDYVIPTTRSGLPAAYCATA